MREITAEQLAEIIELHRKWVYGLDGGSRADLSDADLRRADLSRADLSDANLRRANLRGANLSDADLSRANLRHANLSDADLSRADLSDANLSRADLSGANLSHANLSGANLSHANLSDADLSRADLRGANLSHANLSDADLSRADLSYIRDDLWAVLSAAPAEVAGLKAALAEGRVDGSTYQGECACLVGTIANIRHVSYESIPNLKPDSSRPAEVWFLNIRKGDTPETNQCAALALAWIDTWLSNMQAAFGVAQAA